MFANATSHTPCSLGSRCDNRVVVSCQPDNNGSPEKQPRRKEEIRMVRRSWAFVVSITALWAEGIAIPDVVTAEPDSQRTTASLPRVAEGDWPWWRGPTLEGKSQDGQVVTTWSRTENVLWQAKVPGRGPFQPHRVRRACLLDHGR
jgi:hypothetical protein